ncbi:MAG: KOW motif-containing protein [Deltaproteobacteria bacterium]|nr:KOW motif-containing protein [Deltaproteobacteria bacterium]
MPRSVEEYPRISFPEDVLEHRVDGELWWVAHTKSRREKALAVLLERQRIGYFLPLMKKRYRSSGRARISIVPMFSGYAFFKGSRLDRYHALKTGHVANVLEVSDQQQLVRELKQIQKAICLDAPVEPFPFVKQGNRVRVVDGPFMGLEGVIERRKRSDRLILSVDTIRRSVALEIDADSVEPVS